MGKIRIELDKACPACSTSCESLYIGIRAEHDGKFHCACEDLCRRNWEKFKHRLDDATKEANRVR